MDDTFLIGPIREEESLRLLFKYIPKHLEADDIVALLNPKNNLYLKVAPQEDQTSDSPDSITEEIVSSRIREIILQFLENQNDEKRLEESSESNLHYKIERLVKFLEKTLSKSLKSKVSIQEIFKENKEPNKENFRSSRKNDLRTYPKNSSDEEQPSTSGHLNKPAEPSTSEHSNDQDVFSNSPDVCDSMDRTKKHCGTQTCPSRCRTCSDDMMPSTSRSFTPSDQESSPHLRPARVPELTNDSPDVPLQRPVPVDHVQFFSNISLSMDSFTDDYHANIQRIAEEAKARWQEYAVRNGLLHTNQDGNPCYQHPEIDNVNELRKCISATDQYMRDRYSLLRTFSGQVTGLEEFLSNPPRDLFHSDPALLTNLYPPATIVTCEPTTTTITITTSNQPMAVVTTTCQPSASFEVTTSCQPTNTIATNTAQLSSQDQPSTSYSCRIDCSRSERPFQRTASIFSDSDSSEVETNNTQGHNCQLILRKFYDAVIMNQLNRWNFPTSSQQCFETKNSDDNADICPDSNNEQLNESNEQLKEKSVQIIRTLENILRDTSDDKIVADESNANNCQSNEKEPIEHKSDVDEPACKKYDGEEEESKNIATTSNDKSEQKDNTKDKGDDVTKKQQSEPLVEEGTDAKDDKEEVKIDVPKATSSPKNIIKTNEQPKKIKFKKNVAKYHKNKKDDICQKVDDNQIKCKEDNLATDNSDGNSHNQGSSEKSDIDVIDEESKDIKKDKGKNEEKNK